MPRKIRMAVIGCGRQADLAYFPWILENPRAELTTAADLSEELLARARKRYGVKKTFLDWRRMFDNCALDAVVVCTPPWAHAEPVIEAANRRLHILCEKPMAANSSECRDMIAAAEKNNVILQIGFSLRFDPGFEALKTIIKNGELGRIFQLRSTYDGWIPDIGNPVIREAISLIDKTKIFPPGMGAWRMNDPRAGGVYTDHAIHYIDMFRWFTEERITHVSGVAQRVVQGRTNDDHSSSLIHFESGAAAYIQASLCRFSARGSRDEGLIHGTDGCAKYRMDQSWYILGFPHLNHTHASVWKFGIPSFVLNRFLPMPIKSGRKYCMFKRQLDHFVSRVDGSWQPHPVFGNWWAATGEDGLNAIRTVEAFYRSSETGEQIVL